MPGGRPRNPREIVPPEEVMSRQQVMQEDWRLLELIPAVDSTEKAVRWLATRGLLRNEKTCHGCGNRMALVRNVEKIDGKRWKCSQQCPGSAKSIRFGSCFMNSNMTLTQGILMLYFLAADVPPTQIAHELKVSYSTVVNWFNLIRKFSKRQRRTFSRLLGCIREKC